MSEEELIEYWKNKIRNNTEIMKMIEEYKEEYKEGKK